jgi:hypothetical protein
MADLEFSWREFKELTDKVSTVAHELSKSQWSLLLAIFAAAADRAESGPDKTTGTLPAVEISDHPTKIEAPRDHSSADLLDQLLHAYMPGPPPSIPWDIKITPPPEPIRPPGGPEPQ